MLTFSRITLSSTSQAAKSTCKQPLRRQNVLKFIEYHRHVHISFCASLTGSCPQALKVMVHGHWYNHRLHRRPWLTVTICPSKGHNIRKAEVPAS